ncbi:MAG: HAD-IA family hydrolase [Clostridia bacterium]|nr:HAD-IA family hydrolase [Clostridia bacterium]
MNDKIVVIFDLDGTLLDTLDDIANAVNYMMRKHGFPERTRTAIRKFLGNGARDLMRRSVPTDVEGEDFEKLLAEYMEYYNAHSKILTKPYDGVLPLLAELKAGGIKTAVVSNKPDMTVKALCKEYFGNRLDFALGDRPDIKKKPSAAPILLAMKELGCERAVYVGDSEVDILAAKNADLPCISLTWGFRDRELLEEYGAAHFADTADELKKQIFGLLSEEA